MINFNDVTGESKTKHNANWPYIPDHPESIVIIGSALSGLSALLNCKQMHCLI